MNWEEIESTGNLISGISCGVHPVGLTKSEYHMAREIYVLQELHGQVDYIARDLYLLEEICPKIIGDGYRHNLTMSRKTRAQAKATITRRITELKKKLSQVRRWLQQEPATEEDWYPDVEPWLKARPDKEKR